MFADEGNFNGDVLTGWDKYIVALLPAVNLLLLIVVILVWKAHYYAQISEEQKDPKVTKP